MKGSFDEVIENSRWLFGNGRSIKLWLDKWNGSSAADSLGINDWNQDFINDRLSDYIYNLEWRVPQSILMKFPSLTNLFSNVHIPIKEKEYACICSPVGDGFLTIKVAYRYKNITAPILTWGKFTWNIHIPTFRSLVFWRLLHHKIPTYESLATLWRNIPSMCNFCKAHLESFDHIFFKCCFSIHLSRQIYSFLTCGIWIVNDFWESLNIPFSIHIKLVVLAAIINTITVIWKARNKLRFNNIRTHWKTALNAIIADVSCTANATLKIGSFSMLDLNTRKCFNVKLNPHKSCIVKEFLWYPPILN